MVALPGGKHVARCGEGAGIDLCVRDGRSPRLGYPHRCATSGSAATPKGTWPSHQARRSSARLPRLMTLSHRAAIVKLRRVLDAVPMEYRAPSEDRAAIAAKFGGLVATHSGKARSEKTRTASIPRRDRARPPHNLNR